jgi:MFS family permease
MAVPSVLAPAAALDLGLPAQRVGWLVSVCYLVAMLAGLNAGWLATQRGAVRVSQWALLACGAGLACLASGFVPVLLLAAIAIGVGYGFTNPAAGELLSRHAPLDRRGLFFSIKQTAVPMGVALAGLVLPLLLAWLQWRGAALAAAVPVLVLMVLINRWRARLELSVERTVAASPGFVSVLKTRVYLPVRKVLSYAPTRRLALTSLIYALTQVSYLTFLVSFLKFDHGYSLALAAGLLSASQLVSIVFRIGWGYVSDRWMDPTRLLGLLGLLMAAGVATMGLMPVGVSSALMFVLAVFCAATAVAWNGVFFADLARQVPPGEVAQATGATQFLTFLGGTTGSGLFAVLVSLMQSYGAAFTVLAVLPALTGVLMLRASRQPGEGLRS